MRATACFTPVAILLGSATIAASLYANPSQQLAQKKLECAQQSGGTRFDPNKGFVDNSMTEHCKRLLGARIDGYLDWPSRLQIN